MSGEQTSAYANERLASFVFHDRRPFDPTKRHVVGVLTGEGVGHEVVPVALALLDLLCRHSTREFDIRFGGEIGLPAKASSGRSLSPSVAQFASEIFEAGGALFCGPGGDRFVYELRREFDLFCKFTPLEPLPELRCAGVLKSETTASADIIAVRENLGGVYQGEWSVETDSRGTVFARHQFGYSEDAVRRILLVACALAKSRRNRLHLVLKPGGIPSISQLWSECMKNVATEFAIDTNEIEVDNAVYQLIANPSQFDVVLSPNMFGDVLADCGSLLLASRGMSFSGNFNERGHAAYQTGHGAARDISGRDVANPIGQIFSLGMMLRESFGWVEADAILRQAVRGVLRGGFRTRDVAEPHAQILGTQAFGQRVERSLEQLLGDRTL